MDSEVGRRGGRRTRFQSRRPAGRPGRPGRSGVAGGQAIVEFALASLAFFLIVFGTIDFGRAIFLSSELHNAVREGARYGKFKPGDSAGITNAVLSHATGLGLTADGITIDCSGNCQPARDTLTISAAAGFSAVTQNLLGLSPITLRSSATVDVE